jgi:hypothetical protein
VPVAGWLVALSAPASFGAREGEKRQLR